MSREQVHARRAGCDRPRLPSVADKMHAVLVGDRSSVRCAHDPWLAVRTALLDGKEATA